MYSVVFLAIFYSSTYEKKQLTEPLTLTIIIPDVHANVTTNSIWNVFIFICLFTAGARPDGRRSPEIRPFGDVHMKAGTAIKAHYRINPFSKRG